MTSHIPRLCEQCGAPLTAREGRLRPFLCQVHRLIFEIKSSADQIGGMWA